MKLFITSNTQFGYRNIIPHQFSYFDKLTKILEEKSRNGDLFIHMGNVFSNRKNVSMDIINNVLNLFEKISKILPVYIMKSSNDQFSVELLKRIENVNIIDNELKISNITFVLGNMENLEKNDILLFNNNYMNNSDFIKNLLKDFELSICGYFDDIDLQDDNIINIGSPYKLNKNQKNKKGILVVDTDKKKFKLLENTYSPDFVSLSIKTLDDIEKIKDYKKDFIDLKVSKSFISSVENKNKLNIVLNKHDFSTISYIDDEKIKYEEKDINDNTFIIRDLIKDYLSKENLNLSEELNTIYKIYESKKEI